MRCFVLVVAVLASLIVARSTLLAAPLDVASYDIRNGSGTASGGNFNYWDLNFTGTGTTNVDGAFLNGGLGDLTDGVIAADNWFLTENLAGTGPYVGWRFSVSPNPDLTFHFAAPVVVNSITVYVDDSNGNGGVSPPTSVSVSDGLGPYLNFSTPDPIGSSPTSYIFSGLSFRSSDIYLRFNHETEWVFVSEITFDGNVVPELAGLPLCFVAGVLALAGRFRF